MKIYADRRQYSLNDFIGKDMWVKVLRMWDITPIYMNVLRVSEVYSDGCTEYIVNWIDASDVDDSEDVYPEWDDDMIIESILEECPYYDEGDCEIVKPLQILSTDEVINIILNNHRGGYSNSDYDEGFEDA